MRGRWRTGGGSDSNAPHDIHIAYCITLFYDLQILIILSLPSLNFNYHFMDPLSLSLTQRIKKNPMGVGFRLNPRLRYCVPFHTPHSFTNSPLCLSSPSGRFSSFLLQLHYQLFLLIIVIFVIGTVYSLQTIFFCH